MPPANAVDNRILFPGNPWPNGHVIEAFEWSATLTGDGQIWCHLHLESVDYDAEDDANADLESEESGDSSNWESRIVWNNYGSCILSSNYWDHGGFVIGSREEPFDLRGLAGTVYSVDPIPFSIDDSPAFGIYCQGHDTVAGHQISFVRDSVGWTIEWSAKIALTYLGGADFEHELIAKKTGVDFRGIEIPEGMSPETAVALLRECVADPENYTIEDTETGFRFRFTGEFD